MRAAAMRMRGMLLLRRCYADARLIRHVAIFVAAARYAPHAMRFEYTLMPCRRRLLL